MTTALQTQLLDRVTALLPTDVTTRTVKMFGGLALMVNDQMLVSAHKDGSLLIRVAKEDHDAIVAKTGTSPAVMGKGRPMSPGWITVAPEALHGDALNQWIAPALAFNQQQA